MNLIEFFGLRIKPKLTRNKKMWKPINTGWINETFACIRDRDVNCFLVKSANGYIAIDSGYKNSDAVRSGLNQLGISPNEIEAVFITHLDIDHAGGVDANSDNLFPKAKVILSAEEEKYLTGTYCRKKVLFHHCELPIALRSGYSLMNDGDTMTIGDVVVEAILVPGHTYGHSAWLINGTDLFSGDCLISNGTSGYCFYDFWNTDTALNQSSLNRLKALCDKYNVQTIITSHSGVLTPETAFLHAETSPKWRKKQISFI